MNAQSPGAVNVSDVPRCPCGCALAAWSMPWPIATAPWSPTVVHATAPTSRTTAPFPLASGDDAEVTDVDVTDPTFGGLDPRAADLDLIDTDVAFASLDSAEVGSETTRRPR